MIYFCIVLEMTLNQSIVQFELLNIFNYYNEIVFVFVRACVSVCLSVP